MSQEQQFVCKVFLDCKMSVGACVARRARAIENVKPAGSLTWRIHSHECIGCEVGAKHSKGVMPKTWPDGSPVVRVTIKPATTRAPLVKPLVPSWTGAARNKKPENDPRQRPPKAPKGARGRKVRHNGYTRTTAQWARDPAVIARGISYNILVQRIDAGWSTARALTEKSIGQRKKGEGWSCAKCGKTKKDKRPGMCRPCYLAGHGAKRGGHKARIYVGAP